ncbi:P1 family peptidase [Corynebacterium lizhenjunii]|uniref:P1 family peptidase n=1 Tax=Corynebacterium lizhenjunii TaxID=2709394 RepID=UPI0013EC68FB|nr:P1 family peptidase [Corynebacterium lizhenjunii]
MRSDFSVAVGHARVGDTGVTALYCGPSGGIGAVDVRGGGPGTRETDLLAPHNTVERVHAFVLSGGSAFGLAAADGAMRELARHGEGFAVGPLRVPIVPAAVIFDLAAGAPTYPDAATGAQALRAARSAWHDHRAPDSGSVGAGFAAVAGKLRGGFGYARVPAAGTYVEAFIVANPVGEVICPRTGRLYGAPGLEPVDAPTYAALPHPRASLNTTIGVVATPAPLSKAQAKRLALAGHDGIARAVRPAHSPMDGDTIFAWADTQGRGGTCSVEQVAQLSAASADAVQAAIVDAVVAAQPGLELPTYRELLG